MSTQRAMAAALLWALMVGCIAGKALNYQDSIEVGGTLSVQRKLEIAKSIATQPQYEALKAEIRRRYPNVSPQLLSGLYLRWNLFVPTGGGPPSVTVIVGVTYTDDTLDAPSVIAVCRPILEGEVRRRLLAQDGGGGDSP
jgi:hypothetical protein